MEISVASPDRREKILESSAELFARKGVATTTVREIGDAAGVFSGSLYHYFKSKNAIVAELMRGFITDIQLRFDQVEKTANDPEDVLRGLIRETLVVIELHPHPTAIYQNDRAYLRDNDLLQSVDGPSRQVREHWMKAIAEGVDQGIFRNRRGPGDFLSIGSRHPVVDHALAGPPEVHHRRVRGSDDHTLPLGIQGRLTRSGKSRCFGVRPCGNRIDTANTTTAQPRTPGRRRRIRSTTWNVPNR